VEADAVVADAQPELGRLDVLEALHVALAGGGEVGQGVQNAQGGGLVNGAERGFPAGNWNRLPGFSSGAESQML
jgi:hypothetical protein